MKIRPEKNQTCMGVKPRTSAISVQCSTNWANKPTGSWSFCWFVINLWGDEWMAVNIRKSLINKNESDLCSNEHCIVKIEPEKKLGLYRSWTRDLCRAPLTELTSQLELVVFITVKITLVFVHQSPVQLFDIYIFVFFQHILFLSFWFYFKFVQGLLPSHWCIDDMSKTCSFINYILFVELWNFQPLKGCKFLTTLEIVKKYLGSEKSERWFQVIASRTGVILATEYSVFSW